MLQSLATVAMAALIAGVSSNESRHNVLMVQLVHRCNSTPHCLPSRIVGRMKNETQRIWSSLDVQVSWVDSNRAGGSAPGAAGLTVVLEEGLSSAAANGFVLAALNQPAAACGWGVVYVWVRQVEEYVRLVWHGGHAFTTLPAAFADTFLGRALGRALAHEIGHYLLGTGHTVRGLMRAHFNPQDLLEDAVRPLYGLDSRQRAALMSCRINQETESSLAAER